MIMIWKEFHNTRHPTATTNKEIQILRRIIMRPSACVCVWINRNRRQKSTFCSIAFAGCCIEKGIVGVVRHLGFISIYIPVTRISHCWFRPSAASSRKTVPNSSISWSGAIIQTLCSSSQQSDDCNELDVRRPEFQIPGRPLFSLWCSSSNWRIS